MKILVTGGTGFVGLNVAEALLRRGEAVVVLGHTDLPAHARAVLAALPGTLSSVCADIADTRAVESVFDEHAPEAVVHAAVVTAGEQRELEAFDRVVDVNLKGTAHVLAAAAAHRAQRVVYVSSGSAYGEALLEHDTVSEDTPPRPDTLYALTKYASERTCARYGELRGLDVVCARVGSVFGPWERDTGIRDTLSLPFQILRHARAGVEAVLPRVEARRDWVYSRDVASGLCALLYAAAPAHRLYNLSSGGTWKGYATAWCSHLQRLIPRLRYRFADAGESANVSFLGERDRAIMATARIAADTAYRPVYDQEGAYADYVDWLAANERDYD